MKQKEASYIMYRLMQPSDWAEVLALWQAQRGDTEEFVRGAV